MTFVEEIFQVIENQKTFRNVLGPGRIAHAPRAGTARSVEDEIRNDRRNQIETMNGGEIFFNGNDNWLVCVLSHMILDWQPMGLFFADKSTIRFREPLRNALQGD